MTSAIANGIRVNRSVGRNIRYCEPSVNLNALQYVECQRRMARQRRLLIQVKLFSSTKKLRSGRGQSSRPHGAQSLVYGVRRRNQGAAPESGGFILYHLPKEENGSCIFRQRPAQLS